jgi:hypothetical protein
MPAKICPTCGKIITGRGRRGYCSDACKPTSVCRACGRTFSIHRRGSNPRHCSLACRYAPSNVINRFWSKVENSSGADCWQWLDWVDEAGYGRLSSKRNGKSKMTLAHRMAWELRYGPIPEGMDVLHHCDNPGCCNPAHLFLGTQADNNHDRASKGRNADKRGEKNGQHKLTWDDACWIHVFANQLGWTGAFIAECRGLGRTTVWNALSGRRWRL